MRHEIGAKKGQKWDTNHRRRKIINIKSERTRSDSSFPISSSNRRDSGDTPACARSPLLHRPLRCPVESRRAVCTICLVVASQVEVPIGQTSSFHVCCPNLHFAISCLLSVSIPALQFSELPPKHASMLSHCHIDIAAMLPCSHCCNVVHIVVIQNPVVVRAHVDSSMSDVISWGKYKT